MNEPKSTDLSIYKEDNSVALLSDLASPKILQLFEQLAKDANTGVTSIGQAAMMFLKAKELNIGFGNAIPHMHVINGKTGIDIHIIRAILSKPSSGVRWTLIKNYEPIYQYITKDGKLLSGNLLPSNITILDNKEFALAKQAGDKLIVTPVPDGNGYKIVDFVTEYKFIRKKKDIDGSFYIVEEIGKFSWMDAITAQLPFDKKGDISPDSAWSKYKSLMIDVRAFTFGARRIANDLLMGCYETTELYDTERITYDLTPDEKSTYNLNLNEDVTPQ